MNRLRLYDLRISRLPGAIGLCREDIQGIAGFVNSAQLRLLNAKEAGTEGWWGTWAEMAYTVARTSPYLTVGREVARIEGLNVCEQPIALNNQFFEYLRFGNGRLPKTFWPKCSMGIVQGLTRNNVPTFVDLPTTNPQIIQAYATNAADNGKRVLIQGRDINSKTVYSQDGLNTITGEFVTFASPFASTVNQYTAISGIQKDPTEGCVEVHAVDSVTAEDVLLLTMQPGEMTANYRRYYFDSLPQNCCQGLTSGTNVTVTAIVKLDLIPVRFDTDYCLIQNQEAIIAECQSVRYSEQDTETASRKSRERHNEAIGLLNGELNHYLGKQQPATYFAPFGTARLEKRNIGTMV